MPRHARRPLALPLVLACALPLAACSDSDSTPAFQIRTSRYTADPAALTFQVGGWAVFTADEAQSNLGSLNDDPDLPPTAQDSDTNDSIAIAVRLSDGVEYVTGVEAVDGTAIGNEVYLVADEAPGADWNGDAVLDRVLLRFSPSLAAPQVLAILDQHGGADVVRAGSRVWFVEDEAPMGDETNLRYFDASEGPDPVVIMAESMQGPLEVRLLGQVDDLLLCALDEMANGDQNGDADTDDGFVLCLVDADSPVPVLVRTGFALPSADVPFAAERTAVDAWRLAFLVSEADQGGVSLNDVADFAATPNWRPVQCAGPADVDATDLVLHVLDFAAGAVVPGSVVNTGISGVAVPADNRLFVDGDVAACLSEEAGFGPGGCDYDGVGGVADTMLRWVDVTDLNSAGLASALMLPVETDLSGGARGAVEVSGRFLVASETTFTVEGIPVTEPFLFWVDPRAASPTFSTDFYDPGSGSGATPARAATDHLGAVVRSGRVPIGLLEESVQRNLNRGCLAVDKDGIVGDGIGDAVDTLASWVLYDANAGRMLVAGVGWAVESANSGLVVAGSQALFRVSEAEDGFDWNADGTADDKVLFRSFLSNCAPVNMGTLNELPDSVAVVTSGVGGALYFVDESMLGPSGADVNDNGLVAGFAVRHFRF